MYVQVHCTVQYGTCTNKRRSLCTGTDGTGRYPEEIYRDEFRGYPISRLTQKGGNGKVNDDEWKGEMKKQSAHLPERLELYHWASPNPKTVRLAHLACYSFRKFIAQKWCL